eukprot:5792141-Amphidinium_carterae.1
MAEAKGLPRRSGAKAWACEVVMDSGDKMRLHAFSQLCNDGDDLNVDIRQNPSHASLMEALPTIIRNSQIYSTKAKRLYLTQELLAAQGLMLNMQSADFQTQWN